MHSYVCCASRSLDGNDIGGDGAEALAQMLAENRSITELS
jgi:hypothetical protein